MGVCIKKRKTFVGRFFDLEAICIASYVYNSKSIERVNTRTVDNFYVVYGVKKIHPRVSNVISKELNVPLVGLEPTRP